MTYKKYNKTYKAEERKAVQEQMVDNIIAKMQAGEIPWKRPFPNGKPQSVRGHFYRGINFWVLSLVGSKYNDPRWITYKQAEERGGHVKKGEKGVLICYWDRIKVADKKTGEPKMIMFCKASWVFNVEQTEGCNIPEFVKNKLDFVPQERAEEILANWQNKPKIEFGGFQACYMPTMDIINMPAKESFTSIEAYYETLFHELGHSTKHASRMNRERDGDNRLEKYSKEELVADMFSAMMMAECGMDSPELVENVAAYCQSWIQVFESDPKVLIDASKIAQKCVDYALGTHFSNTDDTEESQVEEEELAAV